MLSRGKDGSLSPLRKKMRLSSPTYDDQVEGLSQDDIIAFDTANALLSQSSSTLHNRLQTSTSQDVRGRQPLDSSQGGPHHDCGFDEEENPFSSKVEEGSRNASLVVPVGGGLFMKASAMSSLVPPAPHLDNPPEENGDTPLNTDYSSWFDSSTTVHPIGFKIAGTTLHGINTDSCKVSEVAHCPGGFLIPSSSAIIKAKEKMKHWEDEDEASIAASQQSVTGNAPSLAPSRPTSPPKAAFTPASRVLPTPLPQTPIPTVHDSSFKLLSGKQPKPFKSPLIIAENTSPSGPSIATNVSFPHRRPVVPPSPLGLSSTTNAPSFKSPLGVTPVKPRSITRPRFVTPFKNGISPRVDNPTITKTSTSLHHVTGQAGFTDNSRGVKFNKDAFNVATSRRTLKSSGLKPQQRKVEELEDFGINVRELSGINLRTALSYSFRARSPESHGMSDPCLALDYAAALRELHEKGCTLATKDWVENHWSLVLWKLAGMAALDPESESNPICRRWCWSQVIRQLLYRYERDLNGFSRPPLRSIVARDASAESSMVFCVSDIIWPSCDTHQNGNSGAQYPELEVTDGWYRLRARVDGPLTRAIRKGFIKVGRKIAVAAAKLSSQRKEGSEILETRDSTVLTLSGNSSHMAPWHAKLGFCKEPFIATLNSLTPDGGEVALMAIQVIKAYPAAYIEFVEDEDGERRPEGPRDAKEEAKVDLQWKTKRDTEAGKLWAAYEEKWTAMSDLAGRLEERARSNFNDNDDPPDSIHDLYDTMKEDPEAAKSIVSSTDTQEAGWLARHIRNKAPQEREEARMEIERELEAICPPREVKDFCVLVVRDLYTLKHPPNRTAQLTVWDVAGLTSSESQMRGFEAGQRYLVTNLIPKQPSAWMDRSPGAMVYLATRKNSRWRTLL